MVKGKPTVTIIIKVTEEERDAIDSLRIIYGVTAQRYIREGIIVPHLQTAGVYK